MSYLKKLLSGLIGYVLVNISGFLINELSLVIDDLEKKAKATTNPLDDILVDFLRRLINLRSTNPNDIPTAGNFIYGLISIILVHISPKIRAFVIDALDRLMKKAIETDNPYDDIFVKFLYQIFNLEVSD